MLPLSAHQLHRDLGIAVIGRVEGEMRVDGTTVRARQPHLCRQRRSLRRFAEQADRGSEDGLGSALAGIADGAMITGLGIHYRTGGPGDGEPATSGPLPGDRAPNARGLEGTESTVDLFDLLRGPHWSLLAYDSPDPVVLDRADPAHLRVHRIGRARDEVTQLTDKEGEFRRIYRPHPGELILIRPDGHIAARTPADREAEVIDHLRRLT
ncbi:hypothetical protein ACFXBB_31595 [Streptomyces scopuliridis]|uniref:aromatic-ring hydroxylase C-terminal domain-containing protein n=1 Tax=Streptomyces scopuliridis TaxID=452529 RepID=UPI00369C4406